MSSINLTQASQMLKQENTLSASNLKALTRENRNIEVADLTMLYDDPVFSCFLIDESGSMDPYISEVLESQSVMLDSLRNSKKCQKGALYVVQYLFNDTVTALHPFTLLSPDGKDDVVVLKNGSHYNPRNYTALYSSLFHLLQDMAANIANAQQQNVKSNFTIGVITDGEDNQGGVDPLEIKNIIQELHQKNILRASVIIGLTSSEFDSNMLEELKNRLGFQSAISVSLDPKEIRRAFVLASQSAQSGQV